MALPSGHKQELSMSSKRDTFLGCLIVTSIVLCFTALVVWLVSPDRSPEGIWHKLFVALLSTGIVSFVLPIGLIIAEKSSFGEVLKGVFLGLPIGGLFMFASITLFRMWLERWKDIQTAGGVYLVGEPIIVGVMLGLMGLFGLVLGAFGFFSVIAFTIKLLMKVADLMGFAGRRLP
jgi:hypothetical protein